MSEEVSQKFVALLAQANEALGQVGDALNMAVEGMPPANGFQAIYIQQQCASVASVALDAHLLISHERLHNVVGLCRIAFESRINLVAALRVSEFAAQKYLAGAKGNVAELEELIKGGATSPLFQTELKNHQRMLAEIQRDMAGIPEKPWWKLTDVVKAAGMMSNYEARYSTLSKAVHNTPSGLAAKTDHRILTDAVLHLFYDAVETCAALVFHRTPGGGASGPLTRNWKELTEPIISFQGEYGTLREQLRELTSETFQHPEN